MHDDQRIYGYPNNVNNVSEGPGEGEQGKNKKTG